MLSKIYWALEAVVVGIAYAAFEYSHKRMGLYRHFVGRYYQAKENILQDNVKWLWLGGLLIILVLSIFFIMKKKQWIQYCYQLSWLGHWLAVAILSGMLLGQVLWFWEDTTFYILPYFLLGGLIMMAVNIMWAIGISLCHPRGQACE